MSNNATSEGKQKQYISTVVDFVQKERGHFIAVTNDTAFLSVLRTVCSKHLMLNIAHVLTWVPDAAQALKIINAMEQTKSRLILFMERTLNGQNLSSMIRQFKIAYPDIYLIVLTIDVEKHRIMYLHEIGADNFIAKPVSAATIIEKMAFTIKPQTRLGQLIDEGKSLLQDGHADDARQKAREVLELKPGSAAGLMLLGDAERELGDTEAARRAYQSASENADLYLEPLRKLADLAEALGDQEERLTYLEKLDRLSPLNPERKINMGEIHLNLGNDDKAEHLFDAALTQATRDALDQLGSLSGRIAVLFAERDPARSEAFLRRALNAKGRYLSRDDIKLFNQLGISLRQQGKWKEAIEEYEKALRIAPNDEHLIYNMGMAYAEGKQFREARASMERALAINDRLTYASPGIAYNIGVVFMQAGNRQGARAALEIALELKPDMALAKAALNKLS